MKENDIVKKELTNAVIYFEFDSRMIVGKTDKEIIDMCLFHASLIPVEQIASLNGVTKNIRIWYDAYVEPILYIENIKCKFEEVNVGSKIFYFKAQLSDLYISQKCLFR